MSAPLDPTAIPTSGVHLIEASAGTGKTYTITSLFLRLVGEVGLELERIAAVTFTNAATAELKDRVQLRLAEATSWLRAGDAPEGDTMVRHLLALPDRALVLRRLEAAQRVADRVVIFTIHGFAARMLSQYAFESGSRTDAKLLPDDRAIVYDVVTDFWTAEVASLPREQFMALGADGSHRSLVDVARTFAGAFEVPLAAEPPGSELAAALQAFSLLFVEARAAFSESGEELEQLLVSSPALNRNQYKLSSLARDALALKKFFQRQSPAARDYPDLEKGRWTASRALGATKKGHTAPVHPLLATLEALRTAAEGVAGSGRDLGASLRARLSQQIEQRLIKEHESGRTQSFDGLLSGLCQALRSPAGGASLAASIRARFTAILIDEFQDTDKLQFEIFRRIVGNDSRAMVLYLIGDPKQSIYRFRGADVHTYLKAGRESADAAWALDTCYRSSPRLISALNLLFGANRRPFAAPGITYVAVRPAPRAKDRLRAADGNTEPAALRLVLCGNGDPYERAAVEVAALLSSAAKLGEDPVSPGNIAVLTRTNRQAEIVQGHLRELGIPAVMHGDRSVFEAPEATELRRILRALAEPSQRALARAALATRFLGVTSSELFRMKEDVELLELWSGRLRAFGDLWRSRGVAHALEALSTTVDLLPRTLREVDGERRMTNYRHLLELLHEAEKREHLGVVGLLRWFDTAIAAPTGHAMAPESRQVRLESDEDAVTLTTAHKSKGLEYDIVILPSVGSKEAQFYSPAVRFHDVDDEDQEKLEVRARKSSDEADASFEQNRLEELEESLRVAYVALTRARDQVVCLYEMPSDFSPLGWLLHERHLPADTATALRSGMKDLPREQMMSDLARLVVDSDGIIAVSAEDDAPSLSRVPLQSRSPFRGFSLVPPAPHPELPPALFTSSFSSMTRTSVALSRYAREGRDIDEVQLPVTSVGPSEGERVLLADFPRGAGPGNVLHAIFEHLLFRESTPEQRQAIVAEQLIASGFGEEHVLAVAEAVERTLHLPLVESGARLLDLGSKETVREMEFSLVVGDAAGDSSTGCFLSGGVLRRALGAAEEPYLSPGYLTRVRDLGFGAFRGYLRGFIDLVFLAEGRLYVLDYKSNYLGEGYRDYGQPAMQRAMEEHHYLLQGLLYAVALARYGRSRIRDYDHERHFGGIVYLFLRGVPQLPLSAEAASAGTPGLYRFRPSRTLLEALSASLGGAVS